MEWAFRGPLELKRRLGSLDATAIAAMTPDALVEVLVAKPALHRYPASMAKARARARLIRDRAVRRQRRTDLEEHQGPAELLARLRSLPGYGPQKAQIFLAILGKRLRAAPPGWEELAGAYGQPGHRSIADVDGPGAVDQVRSYKQERRRRPAG